MFRLNMFSVRALVCGLFLLLPLVSAQAQFKASVQGTVADSTGALVPDATVTITNKETGAKQTTQSSGDGFYRLSGLPPGRYTLVVEKTGFKKQSFENVLVNAEETQGFDVALTTGEVSETVTVTEETAQAIETENANISRALTTREIREIPQVGRDPYELLRLTPGIFGDGARAANGQSIHLPNTTGPGGSNNSIFQTENQVQIIANGQRLSSNNYLIDGVSVNSFNWGGAALVTPNQESIKEIRVLSTTYSAEDGRNSGAQVKVVSQSGSNTVHGSAFIKYNSPKLNAFNKFGGPNAPPVRVADYIRQFGGSIGAPLYFPRFGEGGPATFGGPDKSFIFVSYEGLRTTSTAVGRGFAETPEFRALVQQLRPGGISARILSEPGITPRIINVFTPSCAVFGNDVNRCRVVPGGLDIGSITGSLGQYVSLGNPTGGGFDGIPDVQEIQWALPGINRGNQYNVRLDFQPTTNDSLTLSTYITKQDNLRSDNAAQSRPMADLPFKPLNTSGTIIYRRIISATTVNEARFNGTRFSVDQQRDATNTNFAIPRVEVEGLPFDRPRFGAERGEGTPGIFAQNIFELSDTLTKVIGNHAFKFGGVYRLEQDNSDLSGGARPLYTFSGLFNLANDTPIFEAVNADPRTGLPADSQRYFSTNYYAAFVQDDWKVRPNFTLNLGLRYEYYPPLEEKDGRLSNLFFGSNGLINSRVETVTQLFEPDRNNFAPRIGFAYSPRLNFLGLGSETGDSTVIRGGFGIAYNRIPVAPLANVRGNPPFFGRFGQCCGTSPLDFGSPFAGGTILYAIGSSNSVTSFPRNPALGAGINPATGGPNSGSVELWGAPQNMPNPYVYLYSLEIQQELPKKFTGTIGYQGASGHKLIRLVNQNFLFPNNPAFFQIFFSTPDVNSNHNALNLNLSRRFSDGFQLQANYRWSKSIDQLSFEGPGFTTNQTFPQDNSTERGPSDHDIRHFFNLSGMYELPFFRRRNDFVGKALGGFEISGVVTARTGFPWTPVVGGCTSTPGGPSLCPVRPQGYTGPTDLDTSDEAFRTGSNFPGGGAPFFVVFDLPNNSVAPPGIGRNSFRGPKLFSVDMSLVKHTRLGGFLGESSDLEFRANFFNVFNQLNLKTFEFGSDATTIGFFDPRTPALPGVLTNNPRFGRATEGMAGRVVELQARFRF
ncbi:MAG TPA: carboxypeptidase regulatory-like domain-containing protein [Pyrinomonadaceae bacterium]|nr:carboxypeptidase regulatory-like domain-containing protein [Pyrinomonadaceae bacterium]